MAHIAYKPGKAVAALDGFQALVGSLEESEKAVLAYAALLDEEHNTIRTVEVYESAEYYDEVHKDSSLGFAKAIKENQNQNKTDRTGEMGAVKLKVVRGFFGR